MIRHSEAFIVGTLLVLAGCKPNAVIESPQPTAVAASPVATSPVATSNVEPATDEPAVPSTDAPPSDKLERLSFSAPTDWFKGASKIGQGVTFFAPQNDAWKEIGFRPNMSVKIRENPGMQLADLEAALKQNLSNGIETLRKTIFSEAKPLLDSQGATLSLDDLKFELQQSKLKDGYPCISSMTLGAFNLNGKVIHTKAHSIVVLDSKHAYTVGIIIPLSHEKELQEVWDKFRDTLRFEK